VDIVKKGQAGAGVAIKIDGATQQLFGRHIDEKETLYSHITRHSIDTLKSPAMRDEVTKEEWALIVKLKMVSRYNDGLLIAGLWDLGCIRCASNSHSIDIYFSS
jgi:hypothetical protein